MMFYKNEKKPKKIIEVIESIDGTLCYNSRIILEKVMGAINFTLFSEHSHVCQDFTNFVYGGQIHDNMVYLNFLHHNNDNIKLSCKFYLKIGSSFINGIRHRDNDLPALISYNRNSGEIDIMEYYIDNELKRKGNKPILVSFWNSSLNEKYLRYYKTDNYIGPNFSVYSVHLINNRIINAILCYKDSAVNLVEIAEIMPEIKNFNLTELIDFHKSNLIPEELICLLDMQRI